MKRSGTIQAPSLAKEQEIAGGARLIAGVDEAGRGPWAGPVVAAAVIFADGKLPDGLNDSKKLTAKRREELFQAIMQKGLVSHAVVSVQEIDQLNILQATFQAMSRSVEGLSQAPDVVLVDGNRLPSLACRAISVVEGDKICPSIAAASIVAKVLRDRLMTSLAAEFPDYGWQSNKGYGTRAHAQAIAEHGVTAHHRRSFAPIRAALSGQVGASIEK